MLRFLKSKTAIAVIGSSIAITSYAISSTNDRKATIEQAYADIDKSMSENKRKINSMYSDMAEYEKRLKSNDKALSEGSTQYQLSGEQGLNFKLDQEYYNPNGYVGSGFNVNNVLKQSEEITNSNLQANSIVQPLVLVSFSMPETTIKRLINQMREVNGSIVFRGFKDDNLQSMIAKVNELDVDKGSIIIDPTLFSRFDVQQVPTFIIPGAPITTCTKEKCETPKHIKVTGDVTINYVLDLVERTGSNEDKLIVKNIRG